MLRPTATILSGSGRYADPWHPFPETTAALVGALVTAGYDVLVREDVDAALNDMESVETHLPDLLVVNVGLPRDGGPSPAAEASGGLTRYLRSGRPLLGMHVSATSFTESPEWERALGGRWVRGISMHPEQSEALIRVNEHPLTAGIDDFTIFDELYSFLRVRTSVQVLAAHWRDADQHPLIWVRESDKAYGRAAYDALGHDARSFTSTEHLAMLGRLIDWLSGQRFARRSESRAFDM